MLRSGLGLIVRGGESNLHRLHRTRRRRSTRHFCRHITSVYKSCCDYSNFNVLLLRHVGHTEYKICVGVYDISYHSTGVADLAEHKVVASDDVDNYARCALDAYLQQRIAYSSLNGFNYAHLALAVAYAHMRKSFIAQNSTNVGKVKVYKLGIGNNVANTLNALAQNVVRNLKRALERNFLVLEALYKFLIGDYK